MNPNRRRFLKCSLNTTSLLAFGGQVPAFLGRTALAAEPRRPGEEGNVLVLVQLSGGNDGLNSVVPYADDHYARARTTLRLTRKEVLRIDDYLGFHPAMQDCRRLFDEGCFSVVQGVGYPKSSRDHPAAERHWQTALPGDPEIQTGWVGRYADATCAQKPGTVPVALVTPGGRPLAINAERALVPQFRKAPDAVLLDRAEDDALAGELSRVTAPQAENSAPLPLLEFLRASTVTAINNRRKLRSAAAQAHPYPQTKFAQRLRTIAGLIRADIGYRIFYTELGGDGFGGFDNHAGQKDNHAALLGQFSGGVGAFLDDLRRDGLAGRVLLMTISEFGRTVAENGRRGTDHGAAAPVFLAGGKIRRGLIGAHPSLSDLDNNALRFHTDFRSLYATVLDQWLGYDAQAVLGERFKAVDIFG